MTVGADGVDLTVPAGKIWLIHWIWMSNNSGQDITATVNVGDGTNPLGYMFLGALTNGSTLSLPFQEGTIDVDRIGAGAYPILLAAGQLLHFGWSALAGKAGNSYWYAMIREL